MTRRAAVLGLAVLLTACSSADGSDTESLTSQDASVEVEDDASSDGHAGDHEHPHLDDEEMAAEGESSESEATSETQASTAVSGDDEFAVLAAVVRSGDEAELRRLVDEGADPLILDEEGRTLLQEAEASMVPVLVELGVDPNQESDLGASPLSVAVREGHQDVVDALLANGANPVLAMYEAIVALDVDLCLLLRDDHGVTFTEPPPPDSQWVTEAGVSTPGEALALVEANDPAAADQIQALIP